MSPPNNSMQLIINYSYIICNMGIKSSLDRSCDLVCYNITIKGMEGHDMIRRMYKPYICN